MTAHMISPLLGHHDAQQLVLQAVWRDHEVEQSHLGGELGQVVRVAQLGRDVETEVAGEFDGVITEFDAVDATCACVCVCGGGGGGSVVLVN